MIGATLREIRAHIEQLASASGDYTLRCARSGDRPVPASRLRFGSRPTAREAARVTEQYRAALRRYDPRLPYDDVIVCQDPGASGRASRQEPQTPPAKGNPEEWTLSEPVLTTSGGARRDVAEFCHRVAAAVFETLAERECEPVESAIMDAYVRLAERLATPDGLCLCLLESMAVEIDRRLTAAEQSALLCDATTRLPAVDAADRPVAAALTELEACGLLKRDTRSPLSVDLDDGTRSVVLGVSGYALSPRNGRLPVLPIVLELHRHQPDWLPSSLDAIDAGDEWRLRLVQARSVEPSGLVSAPITSEGASCR
jgi:hypothetical protein